AEFRGQQAAGRQHQIANRLRLQPLAREVPEEAVLRIDRTRSAELGARSRLQFFLLFVPRPALRARTLSIRAARDDQSLHCFPGPAAVDQLDREPVEQFRMRRWLALIA